jgi:hypothetical protein
VSDVAFIYRRRLSLSPYLAQIRITGPTTFGTSAAKVSYSYSLIPVIRGSPIDNGLKRRLLDLTSEVWLKPEWQSTGTRDLNLAPGRKGQEGQVGNRFNHFFAMGAVSAPLSHTLMYTVCHRSPNFGFQ